MAVTQGAGCRANGDPMVFSTRNGRRSWDFLNWTGGYWWMIAKLVDRSMNLGVSYKSAGFMVFFGG